jgi:hypothetical protein
MGAATTPMLELGDVGGNVVFDTHYSETLVYMWRRGMAFLL